jgi:hypothetical protein
MEKGYPETQVSICISQRLSVSPILASQYQQASKPPLKDKPKKLIASRLISITPLAPKNVVV